MRPLNNPQHEQSAEGDAQENQRHREEDDVAQRVSDVEQLEEQRIIRCERALEEEDVQTDEICDACGASFLARQSPELIAMVG